MNSSTPPPNLVKLGLKNTAPNFHSQFITHFAPDIYSSIHSVFNSQTDEVFSKVIKLKKPEKTIRHPHPKREYWDSILDETKESLYLLKKNLKIVVGYTLEVIYNMSPYCQNGCDFAYSISLKTEDNKLFEAKVFGETPWALQFYTQDESVFLADLVLDENTLFLLNKIDTFLEKSKITPKAFLDSMEYRLSANTIMHN